MSFSSGEVGILRGEVTKRGVRNVVSCSPIVEVAEAEAGVEIAVVAEGAGGGVLFCCLRGERNCVIVPTFGRSCLISTIGVPGEAVVVVVVVVVVDGGVWRGGARVKTMVIVRGGRVCDTPDGTFGESGAEEEVSAPEATEAAEEVSGVASDDDTAMTEEEYAFSSRLRSRARVAGAVAVLLWLLLMLSPTPSDSISEAVALLVEVGIAVAASTGTIEADKRGELEDSERVRLHLLRRVVIVAAVVVVVVVVVVLPAAEAIRR